MVRRILLIGVPLYLFGTAAFWFIGEGTKEWNVFFYFMEKAATALGFACLYLTTRNREIRATAAYMVAISAFMLGYYV